MCWSRLKTCEASSSLGLVLLYYAYVPRHTCFLPLFISVQHFNLLVAGNCRHTCSINSTIIINSKFRMALFVFSRQYRTFLCQGNIIVVPYDHHCGRWYDIKNHFWNILRRNFFLFRLVFWILYNFSRNVWVLSRLLALPFCFWNPVMDPTNSLLLPVSTAANFGEDAECRSSL